MIGRCGLRRQTINTLRLWAASGDRFLLTFRHSATGLRRRGGRRLSKLVSHTGLYPTIRRAWRQGLRFVRILLVACSLADLVRRFPSRQRGLERVPEKVAIQLNERIQPWRSPELMRILLTTPISDGRRQVVECSPVD